MKLGELDLSVVSGGRMRLDGGNMFGVVPKVLWSRVAEPDEDNRIALATNCLLVRSPGGLALIDTGYGGKASERQRGHLGLEPGNPILENLAAAGVEAGEIDFVVLTHLHFDHAGGATLRGPDGALRPAFPNARYFVRAAEWADAAGDLPELSGSYGRDDFVPLEEAGQLERLDGPAEVLPGVRCEPAPGHTRGHQVVRLGGGGGAEAVYLGDLCPLTAHLRTPWSMAYDQFPLEVRRRKPALLGEAVDRGLPVFFGHDPKVAAARLERDPKLEFKVAEVLLAGTGRGDRGRAAGHRIDLNLR